ncbi:MAG: AmmeMemoRadiSam system protein B [Desulfobacteraceae bacterium]|nr:MAG: AmmeMemoRadiSam system protein B [Desulfobacteraceae bacterium]
MQRPIHLIFVSALLAFLPFMYAVSLAETAEIRKPVWAGKFYPETRLELMELIETLSVQAAGTAIAEPAGKKLKAVVIPHAGYIYSGWTAAHACNILKGKPFKKVIIMGPDHRIGFPHVAVSHAAAYQTPLGNVPLHQDAAKLRAGSTLFQAVEASDRMEHSLEVVLPFLQYAIKNFSFIPMVMGSRVDVQAVSSRVAELLDHETLVVVSSDLSHYLPYNQAETRDKETISMILNLEDDKLLARENAACGVIPLCSLIRLADRFNWRPKLIHYSNSGDTAGTKDKVVGYTAIAFYGDHS